MGQRRQGSPERSGEVLERWLKRSSSGKELRTQLIATRWREIVGVALAEQSRPKGLRRGVLTVAVSGSAWLHELYFLRETLRQQINEGVGAPIVREIRLVSGGSATG